MAESVEILFWACIFILVYTYAGYPLIVFLVLKIRSFIQKKPLVSCASASPLPVTLVVAAYNEEKLIREKILNCFDLDYPADLLRLLFITDGSTDHTPDIVREYPSITLMHQPVRQGKVTALNRAMPEVETEIVVFSDANTLLSKGAIKLLVAHYGTAAVGGVAGEKRITTEDNSVGQGEGMYWKYESLLKKLDSDLKTTVGAAGELFSMRTALFTPLPGNTIIEDFVQSLLVCRQGYVVRYEPAAYAKEPASLSLRDEMERKIRISAGAFQAMGMVRSLFNFRRFPVLAFQLISHRILRWTLCPLALVILFICSWYLGFRSPAPFYKAALTVQVILYTLAAAGWWFALRYRPIKILYLPFYFVFMHLCVFVGFARFASKNQTVLWRRAER